jgi:hypothetical protein
VALSWLACFAAERAKLITVASQDQAKCKLYAAEREIPLA